MTWIKVNFNSFKVLQEYMHSDRSIFSLPREFYADAPIFSIKERDAEQMRKHKEPERFI